MGSQYDKLRASGLSNAQVWRKMNSEDATGAQAREAGVIRRADADARSGRATTSWVAGSVQDGTAGHAVARQGFDSSGNAIYVPGDYVPPPEKTPEGIGAPEGTKVNYDETIYGSGAGGAGVGGVSSGGVTPSHEWGIEKYGGSPYAEPRWGESKYGDAPEYVPEYNKPSPKS